MASTAQAEVNWWSVPIEIGFAGVLHLLATATSQKKDNMDSFSFLSIY